jgi:mRNA interferase YafQ
VRAIVQTAQFKRDLKKLKHSGRYKVEDLLLVVELLANDKPLPESYQPHDLTGNWKLHQECHIKPDWLLIYRLLPEELLLVRTGSHSELF